VRFAQAIFLRLDNQVARIEDVVAARNALTESWPAERGPRHRDALETCLKVMDGHRSTEDAEKAFSDAATEAGILAS
jgi:hypothetical protein